MFFEALGVSKYEYDALDTLPFLETIPKNWCYSFVLQHPANHIIYDIENPRAVLVAVYQKMENGDIEYISPLVYREYFGNIFEYPQIYTKESIGDLFYDTPDMWIRHRSGSSLKEVTYDSIAEYFGELEYYWRFVGIMITNTDTGERTKIVNSEYKRVKQIRGNQPNMKFHYYEMIRQDNNSEHLFLSHFPRYMMLFEEYNKELQTLSQNLYELYVKCYIHKIQIKTSKQYINVLYKIHHNVWKSILQPIQQKITSNDIFQFLKKSDPKFLLWIIQ